LEDAFKFGSFFSPLLHESDFEAKPSVLLLGQYSTGETQPCFSTASACRCAGVCVHLQPYLSQALGLLLGQCSKFALQHRTFACL
jgi:hypothetical protein